MLHSFLWLGWGPQTKARPMRLLVALFSLHFGLANDQRQKTSRRYWPLAAETLPINKSRINIFSGTLGPSGPLREHAEAT